MDVRTLAFTLAIINGVLAIFAGILFAFYYPVVTVLLVVIGMCLVLGAILAKSREERLGGMIIAICGIISVPFGLLGIYGGIRLLREARYGFVKDAEEEEKKPSAHNAMVRYLRQAMDRGMTEAQIRAELVAAGHGKDSIDRGFREVSSTKR